jgi:anti-sigma regulatory factor (Ser/Thr protein kinase)
MTAPSKLRVTCSARPDSAKRMRHALAAFLDALEVDSDHCDDVLTATGEALANAIEHAYDGGGSRGTVALEADLAETELSVNVTDRGHFIERELRPDRGFGLRIIRSIAESVDISTQDGTRIRMTFSM